MTRDPVPGPPNLSLRGIILQGTGLAGKSTGIWGAVFIEDFQEVGELLLEITLRQILRACRQIKPKALSLRRPFGRMA